MIRVAITDDHTIFRKSLSLLIKTFGFAEVVIEASGGAELLEQLETKQADIVLLDLQMPGTDGFETCTMLHCKFPEIKILILSHLDSINTISKVMELGVDGYLTKSVDPLELRHALLFLEDKGFYFERSLTNVIAEIIKSGIAVKDCKPNISFTDREKEIMILAAKEYSGKEIGDMLSISLRTVEVHKKNLMEKTNSRNFIGVILHALSNNSISLDKIRPER
ncbi:response regulator transcription factor [Flavobacterium sp. CLA17]|uniref:response regulator transcription factor n=1 Tax=Flavobacterium sp. CLA17 TaxID=2724135 RepID=UPI001490BCCE|nr:response regulator transcription factor [Flavobacterium sp. CLA17]QSB29257.1 response regulator transcription factor [Flavobacterium sp. CLA17]